ncbi:succinate dehydrogenase assembly factor 2 [Mesorhizobium sp. 1M-11]|uniref:FAD assembly factor SdhE n=1 Tax=Mesorhizobium sp. 1M-11 TaxID=1529006 RepID=UPI0006C76B32|nr:succinate dehydrogenase assembly factor 2 [Mesorhizobium sp. 1M-11]
MTVTTQSNARLANARLANNELDPHRKKLLFRSWHRGMREMDLILGNFAEREIGGLTADEIDQYERLLEIPDTVLMPWLTGGEPVPGDIGLPILQKILASRQTLEF